MKEKKIDEEEHIPLLNWLWYNDYIVSPAQGDEVENQIKEHDKETRNATIDECIKIVEDMCFLDEADEKIEELKNLKKKERNKNDWI